MIKASIVSPGPKNIFSWFCKRRSYLVHAIIWNHRRDPKSSPRRIGRRTGIFPEFYLSRFEANFSRPPEFIAREEQAVGLADRSTTWRSHHALFNTGFGSCDSSSARFCQTIICDLCRNMTSSPTFAFLTIEPLTVSPCTLTTGAIFARDSGLLVPAPKDPVSDAITMLSIR